MNRFYLIRLLIYVLIKINNPISHVYIVYMTVSSFPTNDHVLQIGKTHLTLNQLLPNVFLNHQHFGPAVIQKIFIILLGHHGINRDGHQAHFYTSKKGNDKFGGIMADD